MTYSDYNGLKVALDRGVAFVTIDHPPINLLDLTLIADLDRAGRELAADSSVKVVVLQSANSDFFIAHADLNLIRQLPAEVPPRPEKLGVFHALVDRFRTMPKATIAKIEGRCRGGGSELVLSCDMRFAALGRAVLGQPEVGVGIIPGGSGCVRLPRLLGRGRALEIILGCGDFPADVAERYGYVNRTLPPEDITGFVNTLAYRIATFPTAAIALAKEAVAIADAGIEDALAREEQIFFRSAQTAEARRRMAAAMANGMQTPAMEKLCFDDVWSALAES
ncbi:MAG: enoyl-CoA hydratase/isomerase family protein [Deltaproteobacteria bacterium]|nr:enoyl-CoA hydratase/isomerase family protein [Deltaproteobacteria bacterium]